MARGWTVFDEQTLKNLYANTSVRELAEKLDRSITGIHKKANKLNLWQDKKEPKRYSSYTLTLFDESGKVIRRRRFPPGISAKSRCNLWLRKWAWEYNESQHYITVLKGLEQFVTT